MCIPITRLDGIHKVMVCIEHNSVGGLAGWHIVWGGGGGGGKVVERKEDVYETHFCS